MNTLKLLAFIITLLIVVSVITSVEASSSLNILGECGFYDAFTFIDTDPQSTTPSSRTVTASPGFTATLNGGYVGGWSMFRTAYVTANRPNFGPTMTVTFSPAARYVAMQFELMGWRSPQNLTISADNGQSKTLLLTNYMQQVAAVGFEGHISSITITSDNPNWGYAMTHFGADMCPPPPPPPPPTPTPDPSATPTPTPTPIPHNDRFYPPPILTSDLIPKAESPDDTTFISQAVDQGSVCKFKSDVPGGQLNLTINVGRYVGETNPDGTLKDWQTLVSNGVVSRYAILKLPAYDVDKAGAASRERDRVRFNGEDIGRQSTPFYLSGVNNAWNVNAIEIPIEKIRFAKKNIIPNEGLIPGANEITIKIDEDTNGDWCTAVNWASLHFNALAPVVMIHGNNSCGGFFDGNVDCVQGSSDAFEDGFTKPFREKMIPYDNSITMPTASIESHAEILLNKLIQVANKFGAKHLHVVAHSKGGLDSRAFLALLNAQKDAQNNSPIGILSLTTLCTPHHGSVGADYVIDAANLSVTDILYLGDLTVMERAPLALIMTVDAGTKVLRVSEMKKFNTTNVPILPKLFKVDGLTSPVVYASIGADANLDGEGVKDASGNYIQVYELNKVADKFNYFPDSIKLQTFETLYELLASAYETKLSTRIVMLGGIKYLVPAVKETPTLKFEPNDFLVTNTSSKLLPLFQPLTKAGANHATISNPIIGNMVLNHIHSVQPIH